MYELVLKGGRIYNREGKWDIGIKDGKIAKIGKGLKGKEEISCEGCIIYPSFANVHTHVPMSLLRGIGSDLPLMDWLKKVIWKVEGKLVSPEFVRVGALLGVAEMIMSGTTLFVDMYFFEEEVAKVCKEVGIRAGLGFGILDFPTPVAKSPQEYLERAKKFLEEFRGEDLVFPVVCPHAVYTCSEKTLLKAYELSKEYETLLHIHVSETKTEVEQTLKEKGKRPVELLESLGILDENSLLAHCVHLTEEEFELIKERRAKVAHCPESNLKLSSGIANLPKFLEKGILVGLGTDGSASNDDLSILGEMRTCALIHKGKYGASSVRAEDIFRLATENGYKICNLKGGKVEEGYLADLLVIDPKRPNLQPLYDPLSQLVYSSNESNIRAVLCNGKVLMEEGELKTLDLERVLYEAKTWKERVLECLRES